MRFLLETSITSISDSEVSVILVGLSINCVRLKLLQKSRRLFDPILLRLRRLQFRSAKIKNGNIQRHGRSQSVAEFRLEAGQRGIWGAISYTKEEWALWAIVDEIQIQRCKIIPARNDFNSSMTSDRQRKIREWARNTLRPFSIVFSPPSCPKSLLAWNCLGRLSRSASAFQQGAFLTKIKTYQHCIHQSSAVL